MQLKISLIIFMLIPCVCLGVERVYYTPESREIDISNSSDTLLSFSAPPITAICQPSNMVNISEIEKASEVSAITVPLGVNFSEGGENSQGGIAGPGADYLSKLLKLVPIQKTGKANCSIKLTNGENISIIFSLSDNIGRPIIEFNNIYSKNIKGISGTGLNGIDLFRQFARGNPTMLTEITPGTFENTSRSTEIGKYKLEYLGTDNQNFKAWRFSFYAKESGKKLSKLKNVSVGEIYYSAWVNNEKIITESQSSKGKNVYLLILSRNDVTIKEMLEKLL